MFSVQEKHIWTATRNIQGLERNYMFAILPRQLSELSLTFPVTMEMFTDVAIHRLCYEWGEYKIDMSTPCLSDYLK